ncbi:MAG: hypothetical protein HZB25_06380 [Candidatus Eisenbacteria bacterium]|nr:hypothetical protein [Candidatus Eisenbacteria bacterium]
MKPLRPCRHGAPLLLALSLALLGSVGPADPAAAALTPNGKLQIVHMFVGQGDGAVIMSPLGQVVFVDDGTNASSNCNNKTVPAVNALGLTHADYHFASHYHSDHIDCFSKVDAIVHFDQVWDRGGSYSTANYTAYVTAAGARRRTMAIGQVFTLDSLSAHPVRITCVNYTNSGSDENSKSVVLRINYGNFSTVMGGDLQGSSGGSGVDNETPYAPGVDTVMFYKVHHHGSKWSTNNTWLDLIAPKAAVISVGANTYPHPTQSALTRLHNHGVKTYWTDRGGTSGLDFATPDPLWDKIAYGHVTITAGWAGGDTAWISGGTGGGAFRDPYIIPGAAPVVAVDDAVGRPRALRVLGNPVSASARFAVGVVGSPVSELAIYSVDGRQVRRVFHGVLPQGEQLLTWDGRDQSGARVESGVYFARFVSRDRAENVKLLVLR